MSLPERDDPKPQPACSGTLTVSGASSRQPPHAAEPPRQKEAFSRRQFVARLGGAGTLALASAEPAIALAAAEPKKELGFLKAPPGAFDDLPLHHPLYATVHYLMTDLKLSSGYPDGTFSGKRKLVRYEFALATQRLATELQLQELALRFPPGYRAPLGPAPKAAPYRATLDPERPLTDPKRLRDAVAGLRFLFETLTPELISLGAEMTKLYADLDRLRGKAAADIAADIAAEEKRPKAKP